MMAITRFFQVGAGGLLEWRTGRKVDVPLISVHFWLFKQGSDGMLRDAGGALRALLVNLAGMSAGFGVRCLWDLGLGIGWLLVYEAVEFWVLVNHGTDG